MKIALQILCMILSLVSFVHFIPPTENNSLTIGLAESFTGTKPRPQPRVEYLAATVVLVALTIVIQLVWR